MTEYEIAHQTGVCAVTRRAIDPGESFYAVLFETPDGFERKDYSLQAWQGPPEGFFSYWKSRVAPKEEKKRLLVDNHALVNLFRRLEDAEEEIKQNFRFVLALILMRKRLLKYERTMHEEGSEWWQMKLVEDQSQHRLCNPRLSDEQIEAVSKELGAILHGDAKAFHDLDAEPSSESPSERES